jgi:hypothetical protein
MYDTQVGNISYAWRQHNHDNRLNIQFQDTVYGLQALTEYAIRADKRNEQNMEVKLYGGKETKNFVFTKDNAYDSITVTSKVSV